MAIRDQEDGDEMCSDMLPGGHSPVVSGEQVCMTQPAAPGDTAGKTRAFVCAITGCV